MLLIQLQICALINCIILIKIVAKSIDSIGRIGSINIMYPMPMLTILTLMISLTAIIPTNIIEIKCARPINSIICKCSIFLFKSLCYCHRCIPFSLLCHYMINCAMGWHW